MPMANDVREKTRELQIKLYRAAKRSESRRFHALYDKVHRKDFMQRGWEEVRRNRGAPGVDGVTIEEVERAGVEEFLDELAAELREGSYRPMPVRQCLIEKTGRPGEYRSLGIPAIRDRVVQAAAKAVLEPIFEADFLDCSWGFRPKRSAHGALEVVRQGIQKGQRWVVDADIARFFDTIRWDVVREALKERISDRRVLKLIQGWMTAGVLAEGGSLLHPEAGTPQGGVISPLIGNVVLHRLDRQWQERCWSLGTLIRYADDLVILCPTRAKAEASLAALIQILAELGLELGAAKTRLVDMRDGGEGFDFLGFHHRWVKSFTRKGQCFCARWPSRRAEQAARQKIRQHTDRRLRNLAAEDVVKRLNRFLVGWRNYFRHGNSTQVFHALDRFVEDRMARWLTGKHGHHGFGLGLAILSRNDRLGLVTLVGNVRYGAAYAAR